MGPAWLHLRSTPLHASQSCKSLAPGWGSSTGRSTPAPEDKIRRGGDDIHVTVVFQELVGGAAAPAVVVVIIEGPTIHQRRFAIGRREWLRPGCPAVPVIASLSRTRPPSNGYSCQRRARRAPPSMTYVAPVMNDASSDARNRAREATSSGVPTDPADDVSRCGREPPRDRAADRTTPATSGYRSRRDRYS
jgi:hypothetical protein